tara:strand:- start:244 stop:513 length:270 start_codon:yes stop_codon:yes gene_type:complete
MNNILFQRPIASRFEFDNSKIETKQTNQFTYLSETSNIHNQFHYENNIIEQNNTYGILKPISTRDEKLASEEKNKLDYGKKSNATIYNK